MIRLRAFFVLLLALALPASAQAAGRVALVIGNGGYAAAGQLANPVNDARIVGASLRQAGFQTVAANNATLAQFRAALRDFRARAMGADVAMVYFAGHGVEANGRNWLLPVDARLASDFDLADEAVDLDRVLEALTGARVRMVVLDACRNNPFGQNWKAGTRAVTRGLARVEVDDVMVIYAAAPGSTAADGSGANSPFAQSLARRLVEPGLAVQLLGGVVRDDVLAATGGSQRPFVSASITGTPIYLVPGQAPPPAPPPAQAPVAAIAQPASRPRVTAAAATALIAECDRLAANEYDPDRPAGAPFVTMDAMLPVLAIPACTRAVEAAPGNARMLSQLGRAHFAARDYAAAKPLLEQASGLGSSQAMNNLAQMHLNGLGVPRDYQTGRRLLEQAVAKGQSQAMVNLGALYQGGFGVAKDYAEARRLFEQATAKGDGAGMMYLGVMHYFGHGVPRDFNQSRRLFEQASAKGISSAMYFLGGLYRDGLGVGKDPAEARRWFEQGVARGNADAMGALGSLYATGTGVTQDYAVAKRWFEQAAAKNDGWAMAQIGILYREGRGVARDYAEAKNWFEKGVAAGDSMSMAHLGALYLNGQGVSADRAEARRWFERAAAAGNQWSKDWLEKNKD